MKPYFKISFTTFTAWILTSLINSMACGSIIWVAQSSRQDIKGDIVSVFLVSIIMSIPGFGILWVYLLIALFQNIRGRALFRAALSGGFVLAIITAIISARVFEDEFPAPVFLVVTIVGLSAIAAIMLHFKNFKNIQ